MEQPRRDDGDIARAQFRDAAFVVVQDVAMDDDAQLIKTVPMEPIHHHRGRAIVIHFEFVFCQIRRIFAEIVGHRAPSLRSPARLPRMSCEFHYTAKKPACKGQTARFYPAFAPVNPPTNRRNVLKIFRPKQNEAILGTARNAMYKAKNSTCITRGFFV